MSLRLSEAPDGTPRAEAQSVSDAYEALGAIHARYRPLQSLLIGAAATGRLSAQLFSRADLLHLDALAHRLDLPGIGAREAEKLDAQSAEWLERYILGFTRALKEHGLPFELRALGVRFALPTRASILSSLLLSAYLGLAEGQERMERMILEAMDTGADLGWLARLFSPLLDGVSAETLLGFGAKPGAGFAATAGGSNAWAVAPERSASGHALLAGDPHLQVNQLPSLFLEVALRVGDDYWLGASIPGLPGLALGRNRNVAWSGTFGVADNVDYAIVDASRPEAYTVREVRIGKRFGRPLALRFYEHARGTLERAEGRTLAVRWFGSERPAECLAAYLRLPLAKTAEEACRTLDRANTLSLHYVIADRAGEVRYKHCGFIPRRSVASLAPHAQPVELHTAETLPEHGATDGFVCSANEARLGRDGSALSTLAQPPYRYDRIAELLQARKDHDVASFAAMQHDVYSRQAARLLPKLLPFVASLRLRQRLSMWDFRYTEDSEGAHAFALVYRAALRSLACVLGGERFWHAALARTEVSVWWANALDNLLAQPDGLSAAWRASFVAELARLPELHAWGEAQRITLSHLVLAGVPGCDRGPFALPGSIATIRQGNVLRIGKSVQATAPAYRFIADLGEDCAYTALPGGIDGSLFSRSYDRWLCDYWAGRYHRLVPP